MQLSVDFVYRLVQQFVRRQALVRDVIEHFRPHLLDPTICRLSKANAPATQFGLWGEDAEWEYFLHGGGCRLTHTVTGEVIDWDAPRLMRFANTSFNRWLKWYVAQNIEPIDVTIDDEPQSPVFLILDELCSLGKLRKVGERTSYYDLLAGDT